MSRQIAGRFWKWVIPAGITLGVMGLWAPAGADDEKDSDVKKVIVKKDGDEERKEGDRKDVKKEGERKEEVRKDEPRKEEVRKDADRKEEPRKDQPRKEDGRKDEPVKKGDGQGHNDARIDELAGIVKQLAGQVNELREEIRGLRGSSFPGIGNPDEYRKRMEEMAKKFGAANPAGISPEKMKEEMERRFKEKERFAREGGVPGGDAEVQIRREIERLQVELKRISAAREGGDKVRKEEPRKEGGDKIEKKDLKKEEGDRKEGSDAEAREAKERAIKKEAKEREAKERESKEDKKPESK